MPLLDAKNHIRGDTYGSTSLRWNPKNPAMFGGPSRTSYPWFLTSPIHIRRCVWIHEIPQVNRNLPSHPLPQNSEKFIRGIRSFKYLSDASDDFEIFEHSKIPIYLADILGI
jgi:hypothetical protein